MPCPGSPNLKKPDIFQDLGSDPWNGAQPAGLPKNMPEVLEKAGFTDGMNQQIAALLLPGGKGLPPQLAAGPYG